MNDILNTDIKYLSGVGPKRAEIFKKELNICTYNDLITYYPYKYIDRTKFYKISDISSKLEQIQLKGKIRTFSVAGYGRKQRLTAVFADESGSVELVWFKGLKWVQSSYRVGEEYVLFGKPSLFGSKINIVHPELEVAAKKESLFGNTLNGQYSLTEKLRNSYVNSKTIMNLQYTLLKTLRGQIEDPIPEAIINELKLPGLFESWKNIHFPQNYDQLQKARFRLKFDELFYIQLSLVRLQLKNKTAFEGAVFSQVGDHFHTFYKNNIPFELTNAQKRVIKEIRKDFGSGRQMNRLLQGDVGSGKTLVALLCMLIAIDNGFQACLMAPTEILANQHYKTITDMLFGLNIKTDLLTGSTKQARRDELLTDLKNGHINILVGTHALLEDRVVFKDLGFVVIDEQHRFGVAQRARLWKKNSKPPHVLVMTATPIPRTLAMTLYGDLDVSQIDELPPGRKPIDTRHYFENKRLVLFGFLKEQIKQGRQVYIVYPLIRESEKMDYKNLNDGYEAITRAFPSPQYAVSIVHGKMKAEDKQLEMQRFKEGKSHIMVATSVIEVGVDVPNASVMVIESAERFGLSQLHQLRGRVGRGSSHSSCILMTSYKLSNESKKRMEILVRTNDGFEIAEEDLKLRGPGDMEGTQQSGIAFNMKIANLAKDGQLVSLAREKARDIIDEDPDLTQPENHKLGVAIREQRKTIYDWSNIS